MKISYVNCYVVSMVGLTSARQVPDEMPPEVQPGHLQETDSIFNTCEKEYLNV